MTTGRDGAVKLWDTETHDLLGSVLPLGPNHRVRASFIDAARLLIFYDTGEIFEWDPRPDTWEAHACRVAGRNLTRSEWADLFPGERVPEDLPPVSGRDLSLCVTDAAARGANGDTDRAGLWACPASWNTGRR